MSENVTLRLAFYGDDFTGSTDALEVLTKAGAKTALFLKPPGKEQLRRFEGLDAIGVAGTTRAMTPGDMELALRPAFQALKTLQPRHVHYKVCSTFDSSPETGSIGKAIEVGCSVFDSGIVPLLVASPGLGRYNAFGHLFAKMGTGGSGKIYRLDRHPSMSAHPVTPSDESDLLLHLSRQTNRKSGLFDLLDLGLPYDQALHKIDGLKEDGTEILLFDAVYKSQMATIGKLIDAYAGPGKSLFSVGSSGVEEALGDHWIQQGDLKRRTNWPDPGAKGSLLVVSGSCSPVTARQIARAISEGFVEVAVTEVFTSPADYSIEPYVQRVAAYLSQGKNVIVHTCMGPKDSRLTGMQRAGVQGAELARKRAKTAENLGEFLGRLVRRTLEEVTIHRVVIAGGDTSGYTAGWLGIESLEMIAPVEQGAPLCRAAAPGSPVDGVEINFKGGQVGDERYFEYVLNGKRKSG